MAAAICELDLLLENSNKMVDAEEYMSKVPAPLIEFFSYMEEVRDIASIALYEPSVKKKKDWKSREKASGLPLHDGNQER